MFHNVSKISWYTHEHVERKQLAASKYGCCCYFSLRLDTYVTWSKCRVFPAGYCMTNNELWITNTRSVISSFIVSLHIILETAKHFT